MKGKIESSSSKLRSVIFLICLMQIVAAAQSGGNYQITQSVIASGGTNSAGGGYVIGGAIGQPLAGTRSAGGNFNVSGGFLAGGQLAPTAAQVSISGRVFSGKGAGIIRRVRISLLDTTTAIERTTQTNHFGFYRFDELEIGRLYIVRAQSNDYTFTPNNYILELLEDREDVNFTGGRTFLQN